ncbi:hypothetical protein C2G38_2226283 [Gigaspora rosea]|uniref:Uncharacterized protein n=1 Tax=Gigaspora rosea TaxID=44941 RepID=A0A397TYG7_9GLOM|nr:hypothetical protein C2G38_2226283 [Gigaspora rosea]
MFGINIILEERYNKVVPKPVNNCPGYDMKYVSAYMRNHRSDTDLEKIIKIEKIYDYFSIIRSYETPWQWAVRVRGTVQTLLAEKYWNVYYVHCLYAGFGERIETDDGYFRPRNHKSQMAICFDCWKLIKITDVKPKKMYFSRWCRYAYEVKPEDLIKYYWDNECSKANTEEVPLEPNIPY